MTSPICLVNGLSTTNGRDVTKNTTVTIQLADTAGVTTWEITCIGTDDLHTTTAINDTLEITDITNKTATFEMPDDNGVSCIFQSRVNNGVDLNGRTQVTYTTTFKVATLINSNRTIAVNETMESDATFGWAKPVNQIIRASLSSELDAGGDLSGPYPNATVEAVKGTTVGTAGGSLPTGYALITTGSDTADWQPVTSAIVYAAATISNIISIIGGDPHQKLDITNSANNLSNGLTISQTNDNITVVSAGVYRVYASLLCGWGGASESDIVADFYKNGTGFIALGIGQFTTEPTIILNSTIPTGTIAFEAVVSLSANDVIDLRAYSGSNCNIIGGIFGMTLL